MFSIMLGACTQLSAPVEAPADPPPAPVPVVAPAPVTAPAPTAVPAQPVGLPAGAACLASADCASEVCEGQGCDEASPGVCAGDDRMCTMDLQPYCGCDDQTFQSSGTCPGRRFAYEGPCEETNTDSTDANEAAIDAD